MREHLGRLGGAAALAAVALGVPLGALAQPTPSRLEVRGATPQNNCADDERLRQAVERRLGHAVFRRDARLQVSVNFTPREPRGWRAEIVLRDALGRSVGERELVTEARDCEDLDSSIALVTALLVDAPAAAAAAATEPSAPSPDEEPSPAVQQQPTPLLVDEEPAPETEGEPWRFAAGASAVALWGRAPGLMGGARFDFDFKPPDLLWLKLEGGVYFSRTVRDDATGAGAELHQFSLAAAACPLATDGSPSFWLCAGQEIDWVRARGLALDVSREHSRIGLSIFARAVLSGRVFGPLWWRVGLTGGVPLVRDRYIFSGSDQQPHELFRTQPVLAAGELGFTAAIP